jgi:putative transposase
MDEHESLSHGKWDCKYHVVFIPKCRWKTCNVELKPRCRRLSDLSRARVRSIGPGSTGMRNFVGQHFWARGYFVSTVGRDKALIRE